MEMGVDESATKANSTANAHWRPLATAVGITALGAILRLYDLGGQGLWVDEVYSVAVRGDQPIAQLLTASDPHPPLYYLLLHLWMDLFGSTATAARSLSVLFGVATIPLVYLLVRDVADQDAGMVAAGIIAVAPMHVQYSREARMYGLLVFLTCLASWLYVRSYGTGHSSRSLAAYTVAVVCLLYTHVFAVFVVVAHGLHALVAWYSADEDEPLLPSPTRTAAVILTIGLAYFPWLVRTRALLTDSASQGLVSWISRTGAWDLATTLRAFSGLLANYPYNRPSSLSADVATVALVGALVAALAFLYHERGQRVLADGVPAPRAFALFLFGVPILGPFLASYAVFPVYVVRYTIPAIVGFALVAGVGATLVEYRPARVLLAVVVVASLALGTGVYHTTQTNEPWDEVGRYVERDYQQSDTVVVAPHWAAETMDYHTALPVNAATPDGTAPPSADGRVWLVVREPSAGIVEEYESTYDVRRRQDFAALSVVLLVPNDGTEEQNTSSNKTDATRTPVTVVVAC